MGRKKNLGVIDLQIIISINVFDSLFGQILIFEFLSFLTKCSRSVKIRQLTKNARFVAHCECCKPFPLCVWTTHCYL